MRCTLDSIFKVGFGMELNCLEGSSKEGCAFMKAFDDSNALVYWRYVDPFWKLKRFLNIGSEASLRKNIEVIDDFVHQLIRSKRKLLEAKQDCVSSRINMVLHSHSHYVLLVLFVVAHIWFKLGECLFGLFMQCVLGCVNFHFCDI